MTLQQVFSVLSIRRTYRKVRNVVLMMDSRGRQVVSWEEWMDVGMIWSRNYQVFTDEARARRKVVDLELFQN